MPINKKNVCRQRSAPGNSVSLPNKKCFVFSMQQIIKMTNSFFFFCASRFHSILSTAKRRARHHSTTAKGIVLKGHQHCGGSGRGTMPTHGPAICGSLPTSKVSDPLVKGSICESLARGLTVNPMAMNPSE